MSDSQGGTFLSDANDIFEPLYGDLDATLVGSYDAGVSWVKSQVRSASDAASWVWQSLQGGGSEDPECALTAQTGADQEKSLTAYLKTWYRGMKDCYWYDRHENPRHAVHFGYWSVEAGMATLLLGLDDSSCRGMQFYPKDLVDYARIHGAGLPAAPRPILVKTVEAAPHGGLYAALLRQRDDGGPVTQ